MRRGILLVLCAALAVSVGVTTARAGGGNSANVSLCGNGGWQTLVRVDQTPFKNQGACVAYAARGGTLAPPTAQAQADCEAAGGTFSEPGTGGGLWTCGPLTLDTLVFDTLTASCEAPEFILEWNVVDELYRCSVRQ